MIIMLSTTNHSQIQNHKCVIKQNTSSQYAVSIQQTQSSDKRNQTTRPSDNVVIRQCSHQTRSHQISAVSNTQYQTSSNATYQTDIKYTANCTIQTKTSLLYLKINVFQHPPCIPSFGTLHSQNFHLFHHHNASFSMPPISSSWYES
jgi:hypothetical protein